MTRIVIQPLGGLAFALGRKRDRTADLQHHLGHGLAQASEQLVELGQPLAALTVGLAHMDVQHGGAGVVAVDRLLDLLVHRDRDIVRVARDPLGAIRRHLNHELFLVLGQQGVV
ncbi:hypothetical protein AWV80_01480 [Cupriavidus sp. UYMU48A]|nr:hypothetical protein AWV80_01480 [Cupriavidus sp. UYMU48A]